MQQQQITIKMNDIPVDAPILVATSAGVDSMALLAMLHHQGVPVVACYVNHLQRLEEAKKEVECVSTFCKEHDIPFFYQEIAIPEHRKIGNKQNFFREERYQRLLQVATTENIQYIATAHHLDDQAETIFMRMAKDYSPTTFTGILDKRNLSDIQIIRPVLELKKQQLEEYCRAHHIAYCFDSSNQDDYYFRNSIRNSIFPLLEQENKQFAREFVHSMTLFQELYEDAYEFIFLRLQPVFQRSGENRIYWQDISSYYESKTKQYQCLILKVIVEKKFNIKLDINYMMLCRISEMMHSKKQKIEIRKNEFLGMQYGYLYYEKNEEMTTIDAPLTIGKQNIGGYQVECVYVDQKESGQQNVVYVESLEQLTVKTLMPTDKMTFNYGHKKMNRLYIDEKILPMDRKMAIGVFDVNAQCVMADFITGKKSLFSNKEKKSQVAIYWEKQ